MDMEYEATEDGQVFDLVPSSSDPQSYFSLTSAGRSSAFGLDPVGQVASRSEEEVQHPTSLRRYINLFELVANNLRLSKKGVRDFAALGKLIASKDENEFPRGSNKAKQKIKHSFRERRTSRMLSLWTTLLKERKVNLNHLFNGAPLSEEFANWMKTFLDEKIVKKEKNAGLILELPGEPRLVFMTELVRLHLEYDTFSCVRWFGSLFLEADVEASILWRCSCEICNAFRCDLPSRSDRVALDAKPIPIPASTLEYFRLDFTKYKARQYVELLIAHEAEGTESLRSSERFLGWSDHQFEHALVSTHNLSECHICSQDKGDSSLKRLSLEALLPSNKKQAVQPIGSLTSINAAEEVCKSWTEPTDLF